MLEIKVSVKVEGLDRLADALIAMAGVKAEPTTASTVIDATTASTPVAQPAQANTPTVAATPPAQAVPVSTVSYNMEDLTRAAMTLMDAGKQADLQALLANFGVESLPQLPPEHYGAFATGMRGLGAQI